MGDRRNACRGDAPIRVLGLPAVIRASTVELPATGLLPSRPALRIHEFDVLVFFVVTKYTISHRYRHATAPDLPNTPQRHTESP